MQLCSVLIGATAAMRPARCECNCVLFGATMCCVLFGSVLLLCSVRFSAVLRCVRFSAAAAVSSVLIAVNAAVLLSL